MKPDYLFLTNERKVRIEWNLNSLSEWSQMTGKEITDLATGKPDLSVLRTIAWCSAREGERLDGHEFELDEIEFGGLIDMPCVILFSQILTSQTSGLEQKKSEAPTKLPRLFFRKK